MPKYRVEIPATVCCDISAPDRVVALHVALQMIQDDQATGTTELDIANNSILYLGSDSERPSILYGPLED